MMEIIAIIAVLAVSVLLVSQIDIEGQRDRLPDAGVDPVDEAVTTTPRPMPGPWWCGYTEG